MSGYVDTNITYINQYQFGDSIGKFERACGKWFAEHPGGIVIFLQGPGDAEKTSMGVL
jgi:hypothetical protein